MRVSDVHAEKDITNADQHEKSRADVDDAGKVQRVEQDEHEHRDAHHASRRLVACDYRV